MLDLYRARPLRLSPQELEAAQTLAHLATSYLVISADREAADRARAELARRAMHDQLTDLPVRWVLLEQLTRSLARLTRHGGQVAVLLLDLDGLKYVNDTYGHAAGDELLARPRPGRFQRSRASTACRRPPGRCAAVAGSSVGSGSPRSRPAWMVSASLRSWTGW